MPKMTIERLGIIFGILVPLWGGAAYLWAYEKTLVKSYQLDAYKLDAQIERTELLMELLIAKPNKQQHDIDKYDLAKTRLGNLMAQRDNMLNPKEAE